MWADELHIYDQMQVGERVCYDSAMERSTVLLSCHFDTVTQRFKNPKGKTGIRGRGELGRWGPNHAADVIVTRRAPRPMARTWRSSAQRMWATASRPYAGLLAWWSHHP